MNLPNQHELSFVSSEVMFTSCRINLYINLVSPRMNPRSLLPGHPFIWLNRTPPATPSLLHHQRRYWSTSYYYLRAALFLPSLSPTTCLSPLRLFLTRQLLLRHHLPKLVNLIGLAVGREVRCLRSRRSRSRSQLLLQNASPLLTPTTRLNSHQVWTPLRAPTQSSRSVPERERSVDSLRSSDCF